MPDAESQGSDVLQQVHIDVADHVCCGEAIEHAELLRVACLVRSAPGEVGRLVKAFHEDRAEVEVEGRVRAMEVLTADGSRFPVHRIPSGRALRGMDDGDDGHREEPWTGVPVPVDPESFVVTVA